MRSFWPFCAWAINGAASTSTYVRLADSRNDDFSFLIGPSSVSRAESAPGVGSCFTLELPFDPAARRLVAEAAPPPAPENPGRRLRVLTVETDAHAAAMLRASLEQLGHQVVHAADGTRAVGLARICDLDLVVADDPATIVALRGLAGAAARTPVIALTAGDPDESEAALAAGADALLRRPVALPAAARAIATALAASAPANDRARVA